VEVTSTPPLFIPLQLLLLLLLQAVMQLHAAPQTKALPCFLQISKPWAQ
jgi:hypothetical protein